MLFSLLSGGRDDRSDREAAPSLPTQPSDPTRLGMFLLLTSLAVLFLALLVLLGWVRSQRGTWPPPGMPAISGGFWVSTVLLLATSVILHNALIRVRRGVTAGLLERLALANGTGLAFLLTQAWNWTHFLGQDLPELDWQVAGFVYTFTGIHALHVVGGFVPLLVATRGAVLGRIDAANHIGLRLCTEYWHFLDGVWLVTLAALYLPKGA
jgi:cytochrome c oxidase subunit III